jgi:TP901-1 family phage major tail protein
MAGQKGRELLIKYDTGGGSFSTIAGLRSSTVTINNETVDITNKDSAGVRDLLEGAGVNSMTVAGSGVFLDETIVGAIRTAAKANSHVTLQFIVPGATAGGTYEGDWAIASFEEAGEYNGEVSYSMSFESDATITFS